MAIGQRSWYFSPGFVRSRTACARLRRVVHIRRTTRTRQRACARVEPCSEDRLRTYEAHVMYARSILSCTKLIYLSGMVRSTPASRCVPAYGSSQAGVPLRLHFARFFVRPCVCMYVSVLNATNNLTRALYRVARYRYTLPYYITECSLLCGVQYCI